MRVRGQRISKDEPLARTEEALTLDPKALTLDLPLRLTPDTLLLSPTIFSSSTSP